MDRRSVLKGVAGLMGAAGGLGPGSDVWAVRPGGVVDPPDNADFLIVTGLDPSGLNPAYVVRHLMGTDPPPNYQITSRSELAVP